MLEALLKAESADMESLISIAMNIIEFDNESYKVYFGCFILDQF